MRKLSLFGPRRDISQLSPETVATALLKLENTEDILQRVVLSDGQISQLITKIRDSEDLKFTGLSLISNDLSQVAPDVLAGAVTRLEKVEMGDVTPTQLQELFTRVQLGGHQLKELCLDHTDLSAITTQDLLGAIRMLEIVGFDSAVRLTMDQVTAILAMLTEGSPGKLKKLKIFSPYVEEEAYDLLKAAEPNEILEIVW